MPAGSVGKILIRTYVLGEHRALRLVRPQMLCDTARKRLDALAQSDRPKIEEDASYEF